MDRQKPVCIIPARGGSKRLEKKNIAKICGKPLLGYAIEAALGSGIFDLVCVSSDDDEILEVAGHYGADLAIKRSDELSDDKAQVKDVCIYLLKDFLRQGRDYKEFGLVLANNPLRRPDDIRAAYDIFKKEDANCVMSLAAYSHPPQTAVYVENEYIKPFYGIQYMKQAQLLKTLYHHDGLIIIAKTEVFLKEGELYCSGVVPYFTQPERVLDIDTQTDLEWAEFLMQRQNKHNE
ncbi:cytidylyltransferase domain-containing protein [Elusimicrobiota bacterium]